MQKTACQALAEWNEKTAVSDAWIAQHAVPGINKLRNRANISILSFSPELAKGNPSQLATRQGHYFVNSYPHVAARMANMSTGNRMLGSIRRAGSGVLKQLRQLFR